MNITRLISINQLISIKDDYHDNDNLWIINR